MISKLIDKNSGHVCICGKTGSGKSVLAFSVCKNLQERGEVCFALDENESEDWPCRVTAKNHLFFSRVWAWLKDEKNQCRERYKATRKPFVNIFIDECGEYSQKDWQDLKTFLTRGRQFGVRVFLLSQRYCLMNKTARLQCSTFIILKQTLSDVNEIRELTGSFAFDECADKTYPNLQGVIMTSDSHEQGFKIKFEEKIKIVKRSLKKSYDKNQFKGKK